MVPGLILYSVLPVPALVQPAANQVESQPSNVLVARGCSEIRRWYAWTRCGNTTCCKLYIACSNGTIVTQSVSSSHCN